MLEANVRSSSTALLVPESWSPEFCPNPLDESVLGLYGHTISSWGTYPFHQLKFYERQWD